jgi:asparagine synthase (glutamine-hydrolysing)
MSGPGIVERGEDAWVVADVDIVNFEELKAVVAAYGDCDGVLTRLYAKEGAAFVRRLRGAFGLALWDRRRRTLMLAVDHFGMRRLHYGVSGRWIAFGSRLSALGAEPIQPRRVAPDAVYQYLNFGYIPAPETPFQGIRRLSPAHVLHVRGGDVRIERFWDIEYREARVSEARAASDLYRFTHRAVAESMTDGAAKDTGAFLSGGTDSSTVVGLMTRITGGAVKAFSIGFHEDRYDELEYARLAAAHYGASHHHRVVTAEDALEALPRLVDAYDEPFGNNSALGTFFCAQLAREQGLACLLAGDGGDEIFGGNERYRTDRIFARYGRVPAFVRYPLERFLVGLPDGSPGVLGRARRYIRRAKIPNPRRFYSYEFYVAQNASALLHGDFIAAVGQDDAPWSILDRHFDAVNATSELNRLMYLDLKLTIGDNDLLKVTRTAALAGVGVRFPLLALPLVEFTGTLPAALKVRGLEKRYLFKRAFRDLLPAETLAKRKHGFGVPTAEWLRHHRGFRELARETLLSRRALERGYFRQDGLERLLALHDAEVTPFYGDLLWFALMLELWHVRHVDGVGGVR